MPASHKNATTTGANAVKPNNPLQSDFNAADDSSSIDEDERYLVR